MRALLPSLVARPLRLTAVCFLALCAPAGAQTFAEAPSQLVSGDSECVAPTGAPGELAVGGEGETKMLHATPVGFTAAPSVPLNDCPAVATRPNGAGVAAAGGVTIDGALRDPGGAWRNVPIAAGDGATVRYGRPQAAIADSGHAIVAWVDAEGFGGDERFNVRVARRAPGGGFGAPELLGPSQTERPRDIEVGIADNGDAFVLIWGSDDNLPPYDLRVTVASAPAGATFQAPADLGAIPWRSSPSLAVASDGRALVAFPDGQSLKVAERAPGESFQAAAPVAPATDLTGVRTRAAVGTGGRAAVAWQGTSLGRTELITRPRTRIFTLRLKRTPEAPVPHPRDLSAVRQGDRIKVTWRSTGPQPPDDDYTTFWVSGSPTREWSEPLEVRNTDDQRGKGPKFAITLTRDTQDIRFVTLRASHVGSSAEDDTMTVEVR